MKAGTGKDIESKKEEAMKPAASPPSPHPPTHQTQHPRLDSIKLPQYLSNFEDYGYDDLETVAEMKDDELAEIGNKAHWAQEKAF